jgi:hypothetical protein
MRIGMKGTGKACTYMEIHEKKKEQDEVVSLMIRGPSIGPIPVHEVGGESHVGPRWGILTVTPHLSLRPWVTP